MKPPDALTLPVNADLSEASLEDALELMGNPKHFTVHVYTRSYELARLIAWKGHHDLKTYKPYYQLAEEPDFAEYEWMVSDGEGKRVWVCGP